MTQITHVTHLPHRPKSRPPSPPQLAHLAPTRLLPAVQRPLLAAGGCGLEAAERLHPHTVQAAILRHRPDGRWRRSRSSRPRGASNVQRSLQVEGLTFQGQEPTEPAEPSESTDEIGGPKTSTAKKSGRKRRRKSLHLRIRGMGVFEDGTRRASIELFVSEPQSFRMVCFSFRPGGRGNGKWSDRLVTCLVRSPSPSTPRCHAGGCGDTPTGPVEVSPATRDLGHPSEAMLGQIRTQTAGAMRLSFHIPLLQVFPLLKPRHREELVADVVKCYEML